MLSGVNRTAGGVQASAPDKKALEAKRQEILKNARAQGGAQARAAGSGAATENRAAAQGSGAAQTGGTAPMPQTSGASTQGQSAQNTSPGKGWQDRIKHWDAKPDEGKGAKVDVTG